MRVGTTMKMVGRGAREKAEHVAHDMKDRTMERRLDRASSESERLRLENDLLRDEVTESRAEHRRILDLIDERFATLSNEVESTGDRKKKSHKGRWLLFLMAVGGGAYYWFKQRGEGTDEWSSMSSHTPAVTESGTSTTL